MGKHKCKVKFSNGKIVCASEILCSDCPERKSCEELDIHIDSKYFGVEDCMGHDSYSRKNHRIRQKSWAKD